ncbi:peptidoglycan-binding protein [Kinneretia asaccharophila]|uniref:Nucleoid-associated protein YgaU n=1 Tax=Roseateles asaccharophilus TaxID=582607 RepID=A0A4R6N8W8_9BURK|nr:peptidoglycan-binding protein [Roseateles asaccharophilus]MDN3543671.1 peptidoglycan-binding protein [Roseateles asaccharophilus]TDP11952.1 nucleoid-associated protein YgaU [Roseateles asaccharophilus]
MATANGTKQAMTITRCSIGSDGKVYVEDKRNYKMVINPSEFNHERRICYNRRPTLGQTGNPVRFSAMEPDKISFSLTFDGTGVVPVPSGNEAPADVSGQLEALSRIIYDYNGEKHEPYHVQILWGTLLFYGRLQNISTRYTLFKPSGAPLRAKSDLSFLGFATTKYAQLSANRSSPDLSHTVEVCAGDTLPLLCLRIYGDSRYYPQVARFNGLREFRRLQPGLRLHFPPLA